MKDKILYLIEGILDVGIAKSLLEKHNGEFYALIDTNEHVKKFFLEQKIVQFQKVWFYRDYVLNLNKTPDINYLAEFEKKYSINLWQIAYSDRSFYEHNYYHKFSSTEILAILEIECKLFEEILDEVKPNFAIIKSPDYHQSQLLLEICHAKKIRVLTLNHTRFGYRCNISNQTDRLDYIDEILDNYTTTKPKTFEELQDLMKGYTNQNIFMKKEFRASDKKKFRASLYYLWKICNNNYRRYYVNFGRTRLKIIQHETSLFFKKIFRQSFINKNLKRSIDITSKFVYFPLHFQPERSTLIDAPFYTNQLEVILNVSKSLPVDYKLYVKEHPVQVLNSWRPLSFYKSILEMPNVELLHSSISNDEILKHCSLVIVITGTLGLEAAFHNKPSIVFSETIFSGLPSVHVLKSLTELPDAIRKSLNKKIDLLDLTKYTNCILDNSFEYDVAKFEASLHNRFFFGGFLFDVDLSVKDVADAIDENKTTFDNIASEYINAIKRYKEHKGY